MEPDQKHVKMASFDIIGVVLYKAKTQPTKKPTTWRSVL
jgi:hypothetical protein